MRLSILAVGGKMPAWVTEGVNEFSKRMPPELKLQWREIPMAARNRGHSAAQMREKEGELIVKALSKSERVIALDVRGKAWSTPDLAQQLKQWQMSGDDYALVIGGPDGLCDKVLARAQQRWSLSELTLPHPLVRVVLAEQLYRAWTITVNHPYHRE